MNKPRIENTHELFFPKGQIATWEGESARHPTAALKAMHSPTVQVIDDPEKPVSFEGSIDGAVFSVIRDKDNEVVRVTKAGLYRLPVAIAFLRPVSQGAVHIKTFIGKGY